MDYTVDTKLGPVRVSLPSGADYAYVGFEDLNVNQTVQSGSIRLRRVDGIWVADHSQPHTSNPSPYQQYQALYVSSKWNGTKHIEPSRATRDKIWAVVVPAVVEWLDDHYDVRQAAHAADLNKRLQQAQEEVREAEKVLEEKRVKLAGLVNELEAVG